jgi:hypothetical protein
MGTMTVDDGDVQAARRDWATARVVESVLAITSWLDDLAAYAIDAVGLYQNAWENFERAERDRSSHDPWNSIPPWKWPFQRIADIGWDRVEDHKKVLRLLAPEIEMPRVFPLLLDEPPPRDDETLRPYRECWEDMRAQADRMGAQLRAWLGVNERRTGG